MQQLNNVHAYSELYIQDAQKNIAWAFEYGVLKLHYTLEEFIQHWLDFKYIDLIETGNPKYIAGMSGIELARLVTNRTDEPVEHLEYYPSENFWTGWIASYYQWLRNAKYKNIFSKMTATDFLSVYKTMHEEDINRMVELLDEKKCYE